MRIEVKDGKIRRVEVDTKGGGFNLIPTEEIPLSDVDMVSNAIEYIEKHFRVEAEESYPREEEEGFSWTEDELRALFDDTYWDTQKIVFRVLARNPEAPSKNEIKAELEKSGIELTNHTLDGILSSITRRAKHFGNKEKIWTREWDEKEDCWVYPVKKQYRQILRDYWLKEE